MYYVFRWRAPCEAATPEGLSSLNIIINDNNNNNNYKNNNNNNNSQRFVSNIIVSLKMMK